MQDHALGTWMKEQLTDCMVCEDSDFLGCCWWQKARIERKFKIKMPKAYQSFLDTMGYGSGRFMKGEDIFYPEILDNRSTAEALLKEMDCSFILPKDLLVFYTHQGFAFAYFICDPTIEDPPVYFYMDSDDAPKKKWDSITAFFQERVNNCITTWKTLGL